MKGQRNERNEKRIRQEDMITDGTQEIGKKWKIKIENKLFFPPETYSKLRRR
jgi:DNA-binding HxlR family transcriptional regulator